MASNMNPEVSLKDMLRERNVPSNASWEYAIKLMENDPRFEQVRSFRGRKQVFNDYKVQKLKEDREEQRLKLKRVKEQFEQFLQTDNRVKSTLRYREACELFKDLDVWKAVSEDDRRDIYEDILSTIEKQEKEQARELRKHNMNLLRDVLNSMESINAHSTWEEAQQLLLDYAISSSDDRLLKMDKEDALIVFIEHIKELEAEEEDERKRAKKQKAMLERDNRIAFVRYLDELHACGKLTSISKWMNLYPEISAEPRYRALLNQPMSGSTALDLFKFYVEDLKARYEDEKQIIKDILKQRNFEVTLTTTLENFATFVAKDERSANLDGGNLKMIFERLLEKERKKERARLREIAKEHRKLEAGFITILTKHIDPNIEEDNISWESVRPLICEELEFKAIPSEEDRIVIFKRYIHTISETCLHHHTKPKKVKRDLKNVELDELERKRKQLLEELAK